jgi:16S rRNA processing protein RimM
MRVDDCDTEEPLVTVARAVRIRGLKGEITAELLTDFPERFDGLETLIAVSPSGQRKVVQLEDHWFQKDRVILKFSGYDSVESARALLGFEMAVPESDRVSLPESSYYDWELEGCQVATTSGAIIGMVQSVVKTGAAPVLVVGGGDGRERLVPLAQPIVTKVDTAAKSIVIDPPEGLLDL